MIISLENIIKKYNLQINGVIHIGAHFGQEYFDYKKQGIQNMIFFEPVKVTFEKLYKNIKPNFDDNVQLFNIALGNETGEKEMYIETANKGMSSSLLEPGSHLKQYPHITFDTKEVIKIDRLDHIKFDRQKYNMVNIDVQGFELEVFKGAQKTLEFIDIIYTEVNFEEVYKGCCLVQDLDSFLKRFGFIRILTDKSNRTWGDALYLKYQ